LEPNSFPLRATRDNLGHLEGPDAGPAQGQGQESETLLPQDEL
jgi:hypothetical protein